jgi:hypothetical protein
MHNSLGPGVELAVAQLERVIGGAPAVASASSGPLGFLDPIYKNVVFGIAGNVGGTKLAQKMYGARTTAADVARAQAAFKQFLIAGNKLPKGAPNLFG